MTHFQYQDPAKRAETALLAGNTIYLNRCIGGCIVRPGEDDSATNTSPITTMVSNLPEYTGWLPGEWEEIVQCVKEIYSPFNVKIVETRPTNGELYEMIMVAGSPGDVGLPPQIGGFGNILFPGCDANPKGVAFAFTSAIDVFAAESGGSRVHGMCWIIGQETAHNFGLFHEHSYIDDGRSSCNNPMTYRSDCGGQKFFRNKHAKQGTFFECGTPEEGPCYCGGSENSHQKLLGLFGPGTSLIPPPSATITTPQPDTALPATVTALSGSKRGVERLELYLNGHKYAEAKGAVFGAQGQPNPSSYQFPVPGGVPDSIYDIVIKSYDDLGLAGMSPTVTVFKGPPTGCASAETCAKGQNCANGRCFWDPPTGEVGDACGYNEFCKNNICVGPSAEEQICSQECVPGVADSCPLDAGLTCVESTPGHGFCYLAPEEGGCCSVGTSSTAWIPGGLGALVFGLIALRPRRRRS
jgi:MYXO-CTERM domain-containing protein